MCPKKSEILIEIILTQTQAERITKLDGIGRLVIFI